MAITYPLSLPNTTSFASVTMLMSNVVSATQSPFTLAQQVFQHPGQVFRFDARLKMMARADAEEWIAFLAKLQGRYGTFLMGDPAGATARGSIPGTPQVDGASQTGAELDTKGWDVSESGVLKAGDYIQLGSSDTARMYKVLNDVDSDGSGEVTLDIWPDLRSSPADSASITVASAVTQFRLIEDEATWDINTALHYGITFSGVEALP